MYFNSDWSRTASVKESCCTPDLELLAVSFRPKYLPREFGQLALVLVYIPPSGNVTRASEAIAACVHQIECASPDSPVFILGDFNSCRLNKALPTYQQYVTCATRGDKTIDLCYGNIKNAYKAYNKPPLSTADHNVVHLIPAYRTKLQREGVVKKLVKKWDDDVVEELQGCFESTDWEVLTQGSSLEEATEVVSHYITFCEEMTIATKSVKVFSNNKPWITKALKKTLNEKKIAFKSGNTIELKHIQNRLNKEIKAAKRNYKERVEKLFQEGKARDVWRGVKTLAGLPNNNLTLQSADPIKMAEDLNQFYCRFDQSDYSQERKELLVEVTSRLATKAILELQPEEVELILKRTKPNKALGPDQISGQLLKSCGSQLAGVLCHLFNRSLSEHSIPSLWKSSIICPVPKKNNPSCNNDYRPVALTSLVMKGFERLILSQLQEEVSMHTDPLQFAYKQHRGVDDAVLTLLHATHTHLEKPRSLVRLVFVDFSSAFNTVQPHLMGQKLLQMDVNPHLIIWILSFLSDRCQRVRVNGHLSTSRSLSTGAPQGSVISPVLYTLYTNDCRSNNPDITYIKYSDDTVIIDTTNSPGQLQSEMDSFAGWCRQNCLDLNTSKTKELIIDFHHPPSVSQQPAD